MLLTFLVILTLVVLSWFPSDVGSVAGERLTRISRASWRVIPSWPIRRIQQRTRSRSTRRRKTSGRGSCRWAIGVAGFLL